MHIKEERSKINNLSYNFDKLEKKSKLCLQQEEKKRILQIRITINEIKKGKK